MFCLVDVRRGERGEMRVSKQGNLIREDVLGSLAGGREKRRRKKKEKKTDAEPPPPPQRHLLIIQSLKAPPLNKVSLGCVHVFRFGFRKLPLERQLRAECCYAACLRSLRVQKGAPPLALLTARSYPAASLLMFFFFFSAHTHCSGKKKTPDNQQLNGPVSSKKNELSGPSNSNLQMSVNKEA